MEFRDGSERESRTEGKNHNVLLEERILVLKVQSCRHVSCIYFWASESFYWVHHEQLFQTYSKDTRGEPEPIGGCFFFFFFDFKLPLKGYFY